MQVVYEIVAAILDRAGDVLMFPFDPLNRIYWLYIVSSVAAAFFVYRTIRARGTHATRRDAEAASGSFLQFLFPKSVWSHPSAWLDLRYFFFHKIASHFLLLGVGVTSLAFSYRIASGGQSLTDIVAQENIATAGDWVISISFMFVALFFIDLVAWVIHFLQHKVSVLWHFHKVHHSAEVMHPLSNFREHPIDNLAYGLFTGLAYGALYAIAVRWFGVLPSMPTLLGIPFLVFLFNFVAYNLRHSHVWLRWPGLWSMVFPSPAHHHVHHSRHPEHIDKNFAFMFPILDVLFGTYVMPEDNRDVEFGISKEQSRDLDGVLRLYWVPFRDVYRTLTRKPRPCQTATAATEEAPPARLSSE